jgi:hypothetical protein
MISHLGDRDGSKNFICFHIDGELAMSWYQDTPNISFIFLEVDGTKKINDQYHSCVEIKNVKSSIGAIRLFTKYFNDIL